MKSRITSGAKSENNAATKDTVWICSVCGYKHVGERPPKECPVCHAKAEYFDEVI